MRITKLSAQSRAPDRVNVYVDGKYSFSLTDAQVVDLGVRLGQDYDLAQLDELKAKSQFGKLLGRALNYCLIRPHSQAELRTYLFKILKSGDKSTNEDTAQTIIDYLVNKNYLNDKAFATWWLENRQVKKGISQRKLHLELRRKGVAEDIIKEVVSDCNRNDIDELKKVIKRVSRRYNDSQKLAAYLQRQGFCYSDIVSSLAVDED